MPATDFSDVFNYVDLRESGVESVDDVWQVVEKETNYTWQFGSGKPLYRLVVKPKQFLACFGFGFGISVFSLFGVSAKTGCFGRIGQFWPHISV